MRTHKQLSEPLTLENTDCVISDLVCDASGWEIRPGKPNYMIRILGRVRATFERVTFCGMRAETLLGCCMTSRLHSMNWPCCWGCIRRKWKMICIT